MDVVRSWWSADPDANIALSCRQSGILVLDADPRHGGDRSLEILETEIGGLPLSVEAVTGEYSLRGRVVNGRHVLFRVDPALELVGKVKDLPGIDIKWNGYVMVSPSRHGSGCIYTWADGRAPWEVPIADAPDELLSLLVKRRGVGGGLGDSYGTMEWAGERLDVDSILASGIHEGERMITLYKLACAFANQYPVHTEHGRMAVMMVMKTINEQRVFPPLEWGEGGPDDLQPHVARAIDFVASNPKTTRASLAIDPSMTAWVENQRAATAATASSGTQAPNPTAQVFGQVPTPRDPDTTPGDTSDAIPGMAAAMDIVGLPPDLDANPGNEGNGATARRTLTDQGNAARLVDYYGGLIRYTDGVGWFVWDGEYWKPDAGGSVTLEKTGVLYQLVLREMIREGIDPTDEAAKQYTSWAMQCKSVGRMKSSMELWKVNSGWTNTTVETWDANPLLLGVQNGVVDLKTGALLPSHPSQYITRKTRASYTPGLRNIRWEEFLNFATQGDRELQEWLQRAAGYTLTGLRDHDVLFLVYGPPGSGKSTFLEALGHVLGDYFWMMPSQVIVESKLGSSSDEYHWAQLRGRRMVIFSELPEARNIKEDAIKRLTGDMTITGRSPGERPITFESQAKLWVGTNHRPIIRDEAMWRRIRAIPFGAVPEKPDPGLKPYLMDPEGGLPAVISWAVEGAVKVVSSAARDSLGWCTAVSDASSEYRASEDRMAIFLDEETVVDDTMSIPVPTVYSIYQAWSDDRGEKPMSLTALAKRLRERGEKVTGTGSRHDVVEGRALRPRAASTASPGVEDWAQILPMVRFNR
jgi:P4 family phage/plasmid primase-like protien